MAGGTAVLAQRVLEAVFGDQAVRRLAETAKAELDARIEALIAGELLRYHAILDGLGVDPEQASRLRAAAQAVDAARADGLPQAIETARREIERWWQQTSGPRSRRCRSASCPSSTVRAPMTSLRPRSSKPAVRIGADGQPRTRTADS